MCGASLSKIIGFPGINIFSLNRFRYHLLMLLAGFLLLSVKRSEYLFLFLIFVGTGV
jgi:hypothetical protein